jgi:hypothetical protein
VKPDSGEALMAQTRVIEAIQGLTSSREELACALANLTAVVAEEASRNAGFARRLDDVLLANRDGGTTAPQPQRKLSRRESGAGTVVVRSQPKRARRDPGPWDPYVVYAELGESGLRQRLNELDLEQLRNIIAEHGMDTDRLAMKWRKPDRLIGRIIDRVVERAAKGDAFRRS